MAEVTGAPARTGEVVDITFVGGGPVGLYGTFYAGMQGLSAKLIEALPQLGGQLTALYPEKHIYDVGGFPKILAKDLANRLIEQSQRFDPIVCLGERVVDLSRLPGGEFRLLTNKGEHLSRTVVLTAGGGAFEPKRIDAPGVREFEGRGVYYTVFDFKEFEGKSVLIVGGGDSAVDWALELEPIARRVTLIHRRQGFRAHQTSVDKMMASSVDVKVHYELRRVVGDKWVEGAVIFDNRDDSELALEVDAVVLALGFSPDLGPIHDWGIEMQGDEIPVDQTGATNVKGVFAAGDIVTYPGKLKLIAAGFGEVATAVGQAKRLINPEARIHIHSSNLKF